jgi:hypothetical protein
VDEAGASIGRARVIPSEAIGDANGQFAFSAVAPGTYKLTIMVSGFLDKSIPAIVVVSPEPLDLGDITLTFAGCFAPGIMCDNFGMGAPFIHAQATIEVSVECGVDADEGKRICTTRDSLSDFGVRRGNNGEIYLIPGNGARLAVDTHGQWSLADCAAAGYSSRELGVDQLAHTIARPRGILYREVPREPQYRIMVTYASQHHESAPP